MKYILDTQIFIWWMEENKKLNKEDKKKLEEKDNKVYLSVVSVWEMIIKEQKGKLELPSAWKEDITETRFEVLPVLFEHTLSLAKLPLFTSHKDPFDRMLVAQAKAEKCTILTEDEKIKQYFLSHNT